MADTRRHLEILTSIKETTSDAAHRVKVNDADLAEVIAGDEDPRFVIVEIEEQKSNNGIYYGGDFFTSLAEQVNTKQPVGYLGHKHTQGQDKEDLLPDPQAVWLGATTYTENGKAMLAAKGYLIPASEGGKARGWIKRRAINSVSWTGEAVLTLGKDGVYKVKEFVLESIDFARKNRAGLKNQRLSIVTEMEGGGNTVDGETAADILGKATYHELNEANPTLVKAIKEMAKDEVKDETATAVADRERELEDTHKKEIEENPDITMMKKIKLLLGITKEDETAKPDEMITTLLERLDDLGKKFVQTWFNQEILEKKIPDEKARKLIARLVPVKEMEGDWRSDKGIEKIKKDLEDRADDLLENDDDIQTVIKEMAANRGGARFAGGNKDKKDKKDDSDDEYKDTDNLRVEKVRVG